MRRARYLPVINQHFTLLLTASTISAIGDVAFVTAAPLLALTRTTNPVSIAGIRFSSVLPWLVIGLASGAIADRVQRLALMRMVDAVRALLLGVMVALTLDGIADIWIIYGIVVFIAIGETLFQGASQAVVAEIVPDAQLNRANMWLNSGLYFASLIGPSLGSVLFSWNSSSPFALDAISFAFSVLLIYRIMIKAHAPFTSEEVDVHISVASIARDVKEGFSWVTRTLFLRQMLIIVGISNIAIGMAYGVLPLFVTRTLGVSDRGYGFLMTAEAIGALAAAPLMGKISRLPATLTMRVSQFVIAITQVGEGLSPGPWLCAGMLFLSSWGLMVWNTISISERQRGTPRKLRGRVMNTFRVVGLTSQGLGLLIGGVLAGGFSTRFPIVMGGVALSVTILIAPLWRSNTVGALPA